ncbi:UNVERIFIED_CONTAM: hypothetical protein Scaly_2472500 [Sesamum calycinum]|uniref:Uncharacterized protein n=1 Tax=Sesamum calycinum TaxID=2727403 RepID=A0AAW2LVD7_9LAMI
MDGESWAQGESLTGHRSEPKVLVGQKRGTLEVEEKSDSSHKRVKMRDLESVFLSEAANVASQWLELLNQDIRGRLADKEAYTTKGSSFCHPDQATADAHSVRWSTLFAQMDKALSDEESHLESWLNQVKEMQLHCEKGLYKNSLSHASLQTGPTGNDNRSGEADNSENDLSIRSAAASIYSTCNFLLSMENPPCC